jgi:hypothetical protein
MILLLETMVNERTGGFVRPAIDAPESLVNPSETGDRTGGGRVRLHAAAAVHSRRRGIPDGVEDAA